ncbi:MAG TPA: serine hydrolase [Thermoanaerobaculia bacterium]|nr:serine hydrolase [Thermoanaerobaculia bacterium]
MSASVRTLHPNLRRPRRRRSAALASVSVLLLIFVLATCGTDDGDPAANPPATRHLDPDWVALADHLRAHIEAEMAAHDLPAVGIALVDDQELVWAEAYGVVDPFAEEPEPIGLDAAYRVGSVSKLFTDIAVMQRVERGELELDAPVTRYLTDFAPGPVTTGAASAGATASYTSGGAITLRQLMSHRSGLVREPPVGHYFDPTAPSLAETVASLNTTALVLPPDGPTKYSNAGIAVVGRVLEMQGSAPFAELLARDVLAPLAMDDSAFVPTPAIESRRPVGTMWTLDGREFPAPTFELGMSPAGSLYATLPDLARFLSALLAGGHGERRAMLRPETLAQMWTAPIPPTPSPDTVAALGAAATAPAPTPPPSYGIGFRLSTIDGHRRVGHGGAIYGYATELAALPDQKLGVVVVATRDVVNEVTTALADEVLRAAIAQRAGTALPAPAPTQPLFAGLRERIAGRGEHFATSPPPPPPEAWRGLLGEYGWDHNELYVLELEGKLHVLVEWFFLYPLIDASDSVALPTRFRFPDTGLYASEAVDFERDASGRATSVSIAGVVFDRRETAAEGETFRIVPQRPVEELRAEAIAAEPPVPPPPEGGFREPALFEPAALASTIRLDVRYATTNNFMASVFYEEPRVFLQRPAAEGVARAHRKLRERGYGLVLHDGYRPWHVTKMFWDATPEKQRIFVANPANGSRHNRGCAIDLTLYDLATGKPVPMTGGYDEFSERSYPDYPGGTSRQRWHRELLRQVMEAEGFTVYEAEWWHFDHRDWPLYPILDLRFDELDVAEAAAAGG